MGILTQIKNRFTGEVIFEADVEGITESIRIGIAVKIRLKCSSDLRSANLRSANLRAANLRSANLSYSDLRSANLRYADLSYSNLSYSDLRSADLRSANLRYADLSYSNLSYPDLRSADLSSADLRYADLSSAIGISKYLTTNLYILLDQPGKIIAYKLVLDNGEGIYSRADGHDPIIYEIGKTYSVDNACTDETEQCASGISLATLDWCIMEWKPRMRILLAEFTKKDIAAIPIGSDGKFRVHRCKIVGEKDLKELGLMEV